jgi:hypothetical protein
MNSETRAPRTRNNNQLNPKQSTVPVTGTGWLWQQLYTVAGPVELTSDPAALPMLLQVLLLLLQLVVVVLLLLQPQPCADPSVR